ncbi:MAG: hypothetical protein ACRESU_08990, partial [Gammaproteobacteria bacterium]
GTSSLLPTGAGGTAYFEYDYMNQDRNWNGTSSAPLADNGDKDIRSDFYTAGLQYMFNRDWGIHISVPYTQRSFTTTLDAGGIGTFDHGAIGDIRVVGVYSGFSDDMSSGLTFGLKLANGDYTYQGFDRDTSIGTGTTNLLFGGYHQGNLNAINTWSWFVQGQFDRAFNTRAGYRPGSELDAAAGTYYTGWDVGARGTLAPVLQMVVSNRWRDSGANADPDNSGYQRVLAAPGLEYDNGKFRIYADVEFPVYQKVNGDQLVAPRLYKLIVSYSF